MNDLHDMAVLYVVDALEPFEARDFEAHLLDCSSCQHEVRDLSELTLELSLTVQATPPPSLRAAILARIAETPQETALVDAPATAAVDIPATADFEEAPIPSARPSAEAERRSDNVTQLRSRRTARLPYLVAAASVLLAVGFGGWALNSRQNVDEANRQYVSVAQLLARPDVRTASASLAGGGTGTVVVSQAGARALFVAADVPALDEGEVYELWTVDGSPGPVPAGTFTADQAPAVVDLPDAAVSAVRILVTVEPSGGSDHPTSQPILSVGVPTST